jgi:hypothetical protein
MANILDSSQLQNFVKQRYTKKKVESIVIKSSLLGIMPKNTNGGGASWQGTIRNATATTRSASDTVAYGATGAASSYKKFTCAWASDYCAANISGTVVDLAAGDQNSLVDAAMGEVDGALLSLGISLGTGLYGDGGGAIGQISAGSNVGTPTITLANISQILNFQVGDVLQASVDSGIPNAGTRSAGATVTVTAVNTATGTITVSGNWSAGIAAVAASDFLFKQGDYNSKIIGLAGWLPTTSPTSTAFCGVDRSGDPERLGGVRYNGLGAPKTESLIQLAALISRFYGQPDTAVMNPLDFVDLAKELASKQMYAPQTVGSFGDAQISFEGFKLACPTGMVTVLQDPFCPQGIGYMLQKNTWELVSVGELPRFQAMDKLSGDWLRQQANDSYTAHAYYRATTFCSAPGWNGVVTF